MNANHSASFLILTLNSYRFIKEELFAGIKRIVARWSCELLGTGFHPI